MARVTLSKWCLPMLTDEKLKDGFIDGIIKIIKGEKVQDSNSHMRDVFSLLTNQPKVIPGIPNFNRTGIPPKEVARYELIQGGMVPSTGLDHGYQGLDFKPITTLERKYLEELYAECQRRLSDKQVKGEYRIFLGYLAEVIKYCADSGELK